VLKNLYYNTKDYILNLNLKKDTRPVIFLICLLIAAALWFSNALGKRYETTVSMPIQYTNIPQNKALIKTPPKSIRVKMEAFGYTLLRHKINLTINPINFNFSSFTNKQILNDGINTYEIETNEYIEQFSKQVSSEINIIEITPKKITFEFDDIITKSIPVKSNVEMSFEDQYFLSDSIRFSPTHIEVSGSKSIIDTITHIEIKKVHFKNLNATVNKNVSLSEIPGISTPIKRVEMEIPVSLYTEFKSKIQLEKINVPDSLNLITFPGYVDITCIVSFDKYAGISASAFVMFVDFNDINSNTEKLPVKLINEPANIKSLTYSPSEVEFIIENN
jgi:YbbR domain-containing protein